MKKTIEEIETDIYDIISDCKQSNGQYAADGVDIGKAAKLVTTYIIANIFFEEVKNII